MWASAIDLYVVPFNELGAKSHALLGLCLARLDRHSSSKPQLILQGRAGPIVRISPNEVYLNDPDFIDSLYPGAVERKTNRPVMAGKRSGSKSTIEIT
jgi:hypothetical protein